MLDALEIGFEAFFPGFEERAQSQLDFAFNNTPEFTGTFTADYDIPASGGGTWNLRADYAYRDEQANDAENTPLLFSDAVGVINAAIAYRSSADNWEAVFGGTNLSDERYIVSGFRQPGAGVIDGTYSRPREWYLTFRFFGGD